MKQIVYIANMRLPSERAHSVHVMEMCSALSAVNGGNVFLFVPTRHTDVKEDIFKYYGIPNNIEIIRCKSFDAFYYQWIPRRFAYYIHLISFTVSVFWKARRFPGAFILSRDLLAAWLLSYGHKVLFEVHDLPGKNFIGRWLLRKIPYIITTNHLKKNWLIQKLNIENKKIYIAPNAAISHRFLKKTDAFESYFRSKGWSQQKDIHFVMYVGSLLYWKGVSTLVSAAKFLPANIIVLIIGGNDKDKEHLLEQVNLEDINKKQIEILPHQPHSGVPFLLSFAKILVLPTTGKVQIGREETSPIKAFEYLAAQKPIVASDVPSSREVLDETTAIFFNPDDPKDCARAIKEALNLSPEAKQKMEAAQYSFIKEHTWENRAKNVLAFLMQS